MYPHRFSEAPVFMYAALALAVASFLAVFLTPRWSYVPE